MKTRFAALNLALSCAAVMRVAAQEPGSASPPLNMSSWTAKTSLWQFKPKATVTYDSFGQRYEIADEDTLDLVDEVSGTVGVTLERSGTTRFWLGNALEIGEEATRNDLQLRFIRPAGQWELELHNELRYKNYTTTSDYALSSDYWINSARARARWRSGRAWQAHVEGRFETANVAERNRFNYDYVRNSFAAELERSFGLLSLVRGAYTYGNRSVPDSMAIDYRSHAFRLDWGQEVGLHNNLRFENYVERRTYGDATVRSSYVEYEGMLSFSTNLRPRLRLRPEYEAAVLAYDRPDSVYADGTEQSAQILVEGDITTNATLTVGPRAEFRRTTSFLERSYNQWGAKGTLSYLASGRLWLQFTNEVGVRKHFAGGDIFFSDYVFNWTTLYLSYQFVPRTTLDLFFSLNPESHNDERNNTTTLLLTTAVTFALQ